MTAPEFSVEFDILYNNISSNKAPGLTEYEKSVFLTMAQESLVLDMYSGNVGTAFETTEEIRDYLSPLVREFTATPIYNLNTHRYEIVLPKEVMFKTYESVTIEDDSISCNKIKRKKVDVYPVTQDALYKTENSPFRGANERRVLRLDREDNKVELISKIPVKSYTVRYIMKPNPIIINYGSQEGIDADFGDLTIEGCNTVMTSKLHPSIHRAILSKACGLAKNTWVS